MIAKPVTVITPVYNSDYLFETVDSVISQDYPNIEYIIIDDGSKHFDEVSLREHLEKNNFSNFKILVHERNMGTVRTLNDAIVQSSGEYIFNIGGDDCFYDDRVISDWVEEFERSGALAITSKRMICSEGDLREMYVQPSERVAKTLRSADPQKMFESMVSHNEIVGCSTAQSRRCFEEYGLFDEQYRLIEDYSRYMYLLRSGVVIHFMDRITVRYRQGGISSLGKSNEVYEEEGDRIFRNEILPFVSDKDNAERSYAKWKSRRRTETEFYRGLSGKRGFSRVMHCLRYMFKSPYIVAVYLRNRRFLR